MEISQYISTVEAIHGASRDRGLQFQTSEGETLRGRTMGLHGREVVSFSSCSYLGLEFHPALIAGVVDAVQRYGTQFSSSRGYVSAPMYAEVESQLGELFGGHPLVGASTSLGHQMVLPVIATERDAIVLDSQAHHSVHNAATLAQARGATVEIVRHRQLDERGLETVARLARKHRTVYFACDGVYSMYGDSAPFGLLRQMLDVAPNVRLYVDDAHGMSWAGRNGRGHFLSRMPLDERIVLATSLNKGFAASGGCFVFGDPAERERVRLCGGAYAFSGPVQPPMLGAILASAKVHCSPEIEELQRAYRERVDLCNQLLIDAEIPLLVRNESPIFFLRVGQVEAAHQIAERMLAEGLYINVSSFPTVPLKRAGIRLTLTALHTPGEIRRVVDGLAHHFPTVLAEYGISRADLDDQFHDALPKEVQGGVERGRKPASISSRRASPSSLSVTLHSSIRQVDANLWNPRMEGRGYSRWEGLAMAESMFRDQVRPEHNWEWRYVLVHDASGDLVGATYFTRCLVKDDMFMREELSYAAEARRVDDPYYLTSSTLMLGSPISEGQHLWVAEGCDRFQVLEAMIGAIEAQAEAWDVDTLILRDFASDDAPLAEWMYRNDWIGVPVMETHTITLAEPTEEKHFARMGRRTRRFLSGLDQESNRYHFRTYGVNGEPIPDASWIPYLYRLYRNVAAKGLRINDFPLPEDAIERMLECDAWEVFGAHLDPADGGPADGRPVGWGCAHLHGGYYSPLACGVDYAYVDGVEFGAYRQLLLYTTRRAREVGAKVVSLGFDAPLEKLRLGAESKATCLYVRGRRHDHGEEMDQLIRNLGLATQDAA